MLWRYLLLKRIRYQAVRFMRLLFKCPKPQVSHTIIVYSADIITATGSRSEAFRHIVESSSRCSATHNDNWIRLPLPLIYHYLVQSWTVVRVRVPLMDVNLNPSQFALAYMATLESVVPVTTLKPALDSSEMSVSCIFTLFAASSDFFMEFNTKLLKCPRKIMVNINTSHLLLIALSEHYRRVLPIQTTIMRQIGSVYSAPNSRILAKRCLEMKKELASRVQQIRL
jgi:hypothetical protein